MELQSLDTELGEASEGLPEAVGTLEDEDGLDFEQVE